ncbi:MAG: beta/gamma crystallin-related protein [Thiobacillus sp.]|nr:beta/gamma crystallin-related protein [Thiobacillus sp.]
MNALLRIMLTVASVAIATQAAAQVTFYEHPGFEGRSFSTNKPVDNFTRQNFNDRASSVVVKGDRWEACENSRFGGRCVVLRPGNYPSLDAVGLDDRVSSVRAVNRNAQIDDRRYAPAPVVAQVSFYERRGFEGRSFTTQKQIGNFARQGFNDRASSALVQGDRWEVCENARFNGRCMVLRPGKYASLAAMGLNNQISSVRRVNATTRINDRRYAPAPVAAQVVLYERQGFEGRSFTTEKPIANFARQGFNDRASSAIVQGDHWEVCEDARFKGRCAVLRPGKYPSLTAMGLNNRVSSIRSVDADARIDDQRYAPDPAAHDFRRRDNERLYEANVTSVRAVVGTPQQRCWVETEEIAQERRNVNIPGAIAGAVIGGILGHQVGSGRGQDIATAGGAVAGAAVGAYIGRDGRGQPVQTRDVQRCESAPSQARPDFWEVTYVFRGQAHQMQMTAPPGPTVTVNSQGEPRA